MPLVWDNPLLSQTIKPMIYSKAFLWRSMKISEYPPYTVFVPPQTLRRLVTIFAECIFNYHAPYYARYYFCWLSGLTWVVWEYIAAYGKHSPIRIRDQSPLLQDLASPRSITIIQTIMPKHKAMEKGTYIVSLFGLVPLLQNLLVLSSSWPSTAQL